MVVPAVTKFLSDYPDCRADLRFTIRIVDILAGEIDVAIRVGWLIDSSLRARRLGGFGSCWCIATIRRRARRDEVPSRLGNASVCGKYGVGPNTERGPSPMMPALEWHSTGRRRSPSIAPAQSFRHFWQVLGFAILPDFMVKQDLRPGRLIMHCPMALAADGGIHAVFPPPRFRAPRGRSVHRIALINDQRVGTPRCGRQRARV